MSTAVIALGSNMQGRWGSPRQVLSRAQNELCQLGAVISASELIKNPAWPPSQQPDFLNQVLTLDTEYPPERLLAALLDIEERAGRQRRARWEARVLDLDMIAYGAIISPTKHAWHQAAAGEDGGTGDADAPLYLPHPRMHKRRFVLEPLVEILPDWRHPALLKSATELLADLEAMPTKMPSKAPGAKP